VYVVPAGAKVREIRVNAGHYVDGIQLVYSDADGSLVEMPHLGGRGGSQHSVSLEADEYLTGLSGRCGRYIDSIRFHTNKRSTDSYGGPGGEEKYRFEAASSSEIVGLTGRGDWYVDQLGVIIRERATTSGLSMTATAGTASADTARVSKPASRSRKKTAPASDLVAMPDAAPVTPPQPDLVAIPKSEPVEPPPPDLVAIPDATVEDATTPELVGIPDSTPIAVESTSMATGRRTETVDLGAAAGADDLIKIEGIGPKVAQVLAEAGITTFQQLADTPVERLREILSAAGSRYRLTDPATWPQQASLAAAGDWPAFTTLTAQLKAGRRG
jgi:predicted flap endonuclease-1-like 5' DNA nuclease